MNVTVQMRPEGNNGGLQVFDEGTGGMTGIQSTRAGDALALVVPMTTGIINPRKRVVMAMKEDTSNPFWITDVTSIYQFYGPVQGHPDLIYGFETFTINNQDQLDAILTATDIQCVVQFGEPIVNTLIGGGIWIWNNDDNPVVFENDWQCAASNRRDVAQFDNGDFYFESYDTTGDSILVRIDWYTPAGVYFVYTGMIGGQVVVNP